MNTYKSEARIIGVFFILAFVSYGLGSGLVESLVSKSNLLTNIYEHKSQFIFGIILMALIHSFINISVISILFRVIKPVNQSIAYSYFGFGMMSTTVLIIGSIFLLLLLPLSNEFVKDVSGNSIQFKLMANILIEGGFFAYQIGMAIWGIGGLMLCLLFYKSQLIPRWLTVWGLIAYVIFITGTVAELYGFPIGIQSSILSGLFEIMLSIWLIAKGFCISNSKINKAIIPSYTH